MHSPPPKPPATTTTSTEPDTSNIDALLDLSWVTEDVFPLTWAHDGSTSAAPSSAYAGGSGAGPSSWPSTHHHHHHHQQQQQQHSNIQHHPGKVDAHVPRLQRYDYLLMYAPKDGPPSSSFSSGVPSSAVSSFSQGGDASHTQTPPPPLPPPQPVPDTSKWTTKKRMRVAAENAKEEDRGEPHNGALPPSTFVPPNRGLSNLASRVPEGHPLRAVGSWSYTQKNCFMMTPLDTITQDYFKHTLQYARFAIHLVDPSQAASDFGRILPLAPSEDEHQPNFTFTRPAGRSFHLVVTVMPQMRDPRQLDRGFALIVACRRDGNAWTPACLLSFEGAAQSKTRGRSNEIEFRANVEHCTDEASGRRIWGQRTSHVRRKAADSLKAIRVQPRGPIGLVKADEYCFFAGLFDLDSAALLHHADGTPCIACSNIVVFEPKELADRDENSLLQSLKKLSLFERASFVTMPGIFADLRTAVTTPDAKLLLAVGVNTFDRKAAPSTALPLSSFDGLSTPQFREHPPFSDAYLIRIRAVARAIGWHHADSSLTDPTMRTLESLNTHCAMQRMDQIMRAGIDDAGAWLHSNVKSDVISIVDAERRAEMAGVMMRERRFRSSWTVGMYNPYPERILVDGQDGDKVHCLADTTHEADVGLRDRMQALIRITYCTRVSLADMESCIFAPYVEGFQSRGMVAVEQRPADDDNNAYRGLYAHHPINGPVLDLEKFRLLLHAMHLDYYLYWIHFRNGPSVRRITHRLLEEDRRFPKEYFEPGGFTPFEQQAQSARQ